MVGLLFADTATPIGAAWLSSVSGIGRAAGIIIGSLLATTLHQVKYQCFTAILLGGLFFGCKWFFAYALDLITSMANTRLVVATCTPDTKARACSVVAAGSFFKGWTESLAIAAITLTTQDQSELGTAEGIGGSIRFLIISISTTVYNVVLSNRQAEEIPGKEAPAVIASGLPASRVTSFIKALAVGPSALADVSGISPSIIAVGARAYKEANANSFRTMFLTAIAISCIALITTFFLPNFDSLLSDKVATTLGKRRRRTQRLNFEPNNTYSNMPRSGTGVVSPAIWQRSKMLSGTPRVERLARGRGFANNFLCFVCIEGLAGGDRGKEKRLGMSERKRTSFLSPDGIV
jgi:hypothetical protein